MLTTVEVPTPLGPVVVSLEVDTADVPVGERVHEVVHERRVRLPSGAILLRRWTDARLEVRMLLVRYDEAWNADSPFTATECWGVVWTVLAERGTSPLVVRAATPRGHVASPHGGECLEATEVDSPAWTVTVGGPDDDQLGRRVGSGLPSSWAGKVGWPWDLPPDVRGGYPASAGADGVTWRLPPLEPRERATTHVAVAWAPPDADEGGVTSWFAVDTSPGYLLEIAGIGPQRPHRHGWPHLPSP